MFLPKYGLYFVDESVYDLELVTPESYEQTPGVDGIIGVTSVDNIEIVHLLFFKLSS